MDTMLERVLSLIPRKPDGSFVHGEKKRFAVGIGFKSGEIVSDWIAGRSTSYKDYLYEIAEKHNVAVEWLKGESDQKEKPADLKASGLREAGYGNLTPENKAVINDLIAKLLKSQSVE